MKIRKLFKFEGAHIVRNCSTDKCKYSIHGHSYVVEFFLEAVGLDKGQMVVDFSIIKQLFGPLVDAFDHTIVLWDKDDVDYIKDMARHSRRWIQLSVSPSAEQLSRVFFALADRNLRRHKFSNGESASLRLDSVVVHETVTGSAQCFEYDATNPGMGVIHYESIECSDELKDLLS